MPQPFDLCGHDCGSGGGFDRALRRRMAAEMSVTTRHLTTSSECDISISDLWPNGSIQGFCV